MRGRRDGGAWGRVGGERNEAEALLGGEGGADDVAGGGGGPIPEVREEIAAEEGARDFLVKQTGVEGVRRPAGHLVELRQATHAPVRGRRARRRRQPLVQ